MDLIITNEQICAEFDQLFYKWICKDLSRGIKNEENYLVALGLFSYIEFLGSLLTADIGFNAKNKVNFDEALKLFPADYLDLDSKISVVDKEGVTRNGLYSLVRCGFVHEYGAKGPAIVTNDPNGYTTENIYGSLGSSLGINLVKIKFTDAIEINNNKLLYDFKKVLDSVWEKLQAEQSLEIDNFRKGFIKLNSYKLVL